MLTYQEACFFLRAEFDMRFDAWPAGDFVRLVELSSSAALPSIENYEAQIYEPTQQETAVAEWRRA